MEEREHLSPRARRAIAVMTVALVGLVAGAGFFLWSGLPHPYDGPPPPATSRPTPVSMDWRSATAGWIVVHDSGGPESILFRTTDGGTHWQRLLSIDGPASIRFTDARRGVLRVDSARPGGSHVLRTSDGGATWRTIPLPALEPGAVCRPYFADGDTGWVLARTQAAATARTVLYQTSNGGQYWHRLLDVQGGPIHGQGISGDDDVLDLAFRADGTGWLTGSATAGTAAVFMTRDGGLEWIREPLPAGGAGPGPADRLQIWAPTVSPGGRGVLPVYDRDRDQTWLYATEDGGASWGDPRLLPGGGGLRRPAFVDGVAGWTSSADSAWLTADAGRNWLPVPGPGAGWQLGAVAPVSRAVAWVTAVRLNERAALGTPTRWSLFRTADAGQHWSQVPLPDLG